MFEHCSRILLVDELGRIRGGWAIITASNKRSQVDLVFSVNFLCFLSHLNVLCPSAFQMDNFSLDSVFCNYSSFYMRYSGLYYVFYKPLDV